MVLHGNITAYMWIFFGKCNYRRAKWLKCNQELSLKYKFAFNWKFLSHISVLINENNMKNLWNENFVACLKVLLNKFGNLTTRITIKFNQKLKNAHEMHLKLIFIHS